jgi:hypothetical protein
MVWYVVVLAHMVRSVRNDVTWSMDMKIKSILWNFFVLLFYQRASCQLMKLVFHSQNVWCVLLEGLQLIQFILNYSLSACDDPEHQHHVAGKSLPH